MKRKRLLIFSLVILLGAFFYTSFCKDKAFGLTPSFIQIPVSFFPFNDRPTMEIEIEGKKYRVLIDLGFSRPLSLQDKSIRKIHKKQFVENSDFMGIKGKIYRVKEFFAPEVKLVNGLLKNVTIVEESLDFFNDGRIFPSMRIWDRFKERLELAIIKGRIGWAVFRETVCFFDFPHSTVYLGKEVAELLEKTGYLSPDFIQIPFEMENYGLIFSIRTDLGIKRFLLDTGATCSLLRGSEISTKDGYITDQFQLAGHELGPWQFCFTTISDAFQCDGILGVDFFKEYPICFDFENQFAYIYQPLSIGEK